MNRVSNQGTLLFFGAICCVGLFQAALATVLKIEIEPQPWGKLVYGLSHTLGGVFLTLSWLWVLYKHPRKDACDDSETGSGGS